MMTSSDTPFTYKQAGVDSETQDRAMPMLQKWVERSFGLRKNLGRVVLPLGYFANVLDIGNGLGLAVSTDGVGTKILIAQLLNKYDTIGIDCVAMNVNDIICVGAEPIALLDYVAVEELRPDVLGQIAAGLYKGAEMAGVSIPGGEIAQVRDMLRGVREGAAFDLVGTCVGIVPLDNVLTGKETKPGDAVIGLASSGIHSNGLSLARKVLFDVGGLAPDSRIDGLDRTIGDELLVPTRIYVNEAMALLKAGLDVKAFAHITSTGFLNLARADAAVGYVLDSLPEPHPIFGAIQRTGSVSDAEMYYTYNMGVGFCVVVAAGDAESALKVIQKSGTSARVIGHAVADAEKRVQLPARRLAGIDGAFKPL